ncbi:MAG: type II toxin-antitoxin system PemK/MazF family toxin [Anaerolineae bacterium]|nr:type II toxin-antitoxin system PemK/MazF family toxin [Anaerolineae bacterium]
MKRGDVWWVNFEPSVGGEIKKERPAIIISNDAANRFLNRVQVVPLTTNTGRVYPSEAIVNVNGITHKALADQLTTVSKLRLSNQVGHLTPGDMSKVEQAARVQLGMLELMA